MKPRPWMPASEAAKVLRERGVDPVEALSTLIRETGHSGVNRLWAVGNKITIRNGTTLWLTSPEIDVDVGTIIVPQRAVGRRIPEDRPEPLLINPHELDRRWPDRPQPRKEKTNSVQQMEREAGNYFSDTIVPRGLATRDDTWEELKTKFPHVSERHFKTVIWKTRAPDEWKRSGRRKGSNAINR